MDFLFSHASSRVSYPICLFRYQTKQSSLNLGEDFAGSEKLGLAPKVLHNLLGSPELFFNRLFTLWKHPQNLPAEPQRFCRVLGRRGEPGPVLEDRLLFFSHKSGGKLLWPNMFLGGTSLSLCVPTPPAKIHSWKLQKSSHIYIYIYAIVLKWGPSLGPVFSPCRTKHF